MLEAQNYEELRDVLTELYKEVVWTWTYSRRIARLDSLLQGRLLLLQELLLLLWLSIALGQHLLAGALSLLLVLLSCGWCYVIRVVIGIGSC